MNEVEKQTTSYLESLPNQCFTCGFMGVLIFQSFNVACYDLTANFTVLDLGFRLIARTKQTLATWSIFLTENYVSF